MSRRTERVDDLLRRELSELIMRQLHDPRVRMASVVSVDVSPDLRHAVVRVSALGDEQQRRDTVAGLQHAKGFLRSRLADRLRMRTVPELVFELDRGAEYSQQISELLEKLHDEDEEAGS